MKLERLGALQQNLVYEAFSDIFFFSLFLKIKMFGWK